MFSSGRVLLLVALSAAACSEAPVLTTSEEDVASPVSEDDAGSHTNGDAASGRPGPLPDAGESELVKVASTLELEWEPCPLFTGSAPGELPNFQSDAGIEPPAVPVAECAVVELPLLWSEPDGATLAYFVKRLRATEPVRGQVWLLQGGPGSPGVGMEDIAFDLHERIGDLDIYIPDHRGTGRSTFVECSESLAELRGGPSQLVACGEELAREWGEDTHAFSTSAAARDVLALATHVHRAGEDVLLWGGSYGGYWAHRVLQVDSARLVTGAVLDGSARPTGGLSGLDLVQKTVEAGHNLLSLCGRNEDCRARLGFDPETRALEILNRLCQPLRELHSGGRLGFQGMLSASLRRWNLLRLVPAMLYRAERCSTRDVAVIRAFADELSGSDNEVLEEAPRSEAIFALVFFSEIVTNLTPAEEILEAASGAVFSEAVGSLDYQTVLADWPFYPPDEFVGQWVETDARVLVLHGALDTQAPLSSGEAIAENLAGPNTQSFFFPTGTHVVYYGSHELRDDADTNCGQHLSLQFLREPNEPVDASCIADKDPIEFTAPEEVLQRVIGHDNPWDDP